MGACRLEGIPSQPKWEKRGGMSAMKTWEQLISDYVQWVTGWICQIAENKLPIHAVGNRSYQLLGNHVTCMAQLWRKFTFSYICEQFSMNNSGTLNYVCCTIILFAHVRVDSTRPLSMNEGNNRTSKREEGGRVDIPQKVLHLGTNWLTSSEESSLWAPGLASEIHDTFGCLRSLWKTLRASLWADMPYCLGVWWSSQLHLGSPQPPWSQPHSVHQSCSQTTWI